MQQNLVPDRCLTPCTGKLKMLRSAVVTKRVLVHEDEEGGKRVLTDIRGGGEVEKYLLLPSCSALDGLASSSVHILKVAPLQ